MSLPSFSADDRVRPPLRADETTTLRTFLDYHRDTLRWKCAGLTQEQLAQALPPADMTVGGIMKHLALVESDWFEDTFAGGSPMPPFDTVDWEADPDWEWHTARDNRPEELSPSSTRPCVAPMPSSTKPSPAPGSTPSPRRRTTVRAHRSACGGSLST
jgi:uncharacterized damage-inducible protein DinB